MNAERMGHLMIPTRVVIRRTLPVSVWLVVAIAGFAAWENYDATPGDCPQPRAPQAIAKGPLQLTMFLHPHCPCARASLEELQAILSPPCPALHVRILFVRPVGAATGWEQSSLWDAASQLPGVQVGCDVDGAEAQQAGAIISGHVVLRDATGIVLFQGGITRGRNRSGDNPGRQAVTAWLHGETAAITTAPVFGCPLVSNF
jgi:hypothetical protein